jgi:hypothetical protein
MLGQDGRNAMDHNVITDRATVRNLVLVVGGLVALTFVLMGVVAFVT